MKKYLLPVILTVMLGMQAYQYRLYFQTQQMLEQSQQKTDSLRSLLVMVYNTFERADIVVNPQEDKK